MGLGMAGRWDKQGPEALASLEGASCAGWAQGRAAGGFCQGPGAHEGQAVPIKGPPGAGQQHELCGGATGSSTLCCQGPDRALEKRWVEAAGGAARSGPSSLGGGGVRAAWGALFSPQYALAERARRSPWRWGVHACTREHAACGGGRRVRTGARVCTSGGVRPGFRGLSPAREPRPCRGGCSAGQKQWLTTFLTPEHTAFCPCSQTSWRSALVATSQFCSTWGPGECGGFRGPQRAPCSLQGQRVSAPWALPS